MEEINAIINNAEKYILQFNEIEELLMYPEIIADHLYYKHLIKLKAEITNIVKLSKQLKQFINELEELDKQKFTDNELKQLVEFEKKELTEKIKKNSLILQMLMISQKEVNNIIVQITSTNVSNIEKFEQIVLMYENYCKHHNLNFEISYSNLQNNADIVLLINGVNALKLFENENGIHKLITDNQNTVSAEVLVFSKCEMQLTIDESDFVIDTFRASGAGGQHINRTNSAVRIKHTPTGITAICQSERSQIQNKNKATKILISKLSNYYRNQEITKENQQKIENRNKEKIREYNFVKNTVTDFRLNKTFNLNSILNGELDQIINNLLFK